MKEIVVISGKGGTGKTSVAASLALLADRPVIADCDVDAPDLHLVLSPRIRERHEFRAGHEAVIRAADCVGCGACETHCRFDAVRKVAFAGPAAPADGAMNCQDCDHCVRSCPIRTNSIIRALREAAGEKCPPMFVIDPLACEGCGVCVRFCPEKAIDFPERRCGEWFVSETRCGPMVHARLDAGAENSGKLVSVVRQEARRVATEEDRKTIIVDGPPGIGCPVIASMTGTSLVLVVTEPTVSGEHDLERVLALSRHFGIPAAVCINKWDINPAMTARIEDAIIRAGTRLAGRIRYDAGVTRAQIGARAAVETDAACAGDIRRIWEAIDL
jgi:MinD superfamily P-loop ATPase